MSFRIERAKYLNIQKGEERGVEEDDANSHATCLGRPESETTKENPVDPVVPRSYEVHLVRRRKHDCVFPWKR